MPSSPPHPPSPPTDGSLSGTPGQKALGKKVTSVVLPIKPASSWPGFKDLAQSLEGGVPSPDTRSSVRMAGLSPDGSEHGGGQYAATARLLADGKGASLIYRPYCSRAVWFRVFHLIFTFLSSSLRSL